MVFCTLLFGLSIGAFDRFVPPGQPTNVESNTPLMTGETLVSAVVPQHSTVVVIQKVIDDHIEELSDGRQVGTPAGISDAEPHAAQIVEERISWRRSKAPLEVQLALCMPYR